MTAPLVPAEGSVFIDDRGNGRALRLTWHAEAGVMVLSLWRDRLCTGSFRLPAEEIPAVIEALRAGQMAAFGAGELMASG
ncbi:hypothetical protein NODU109028_09245 [Nocardioides dubius]|uniref:Uncharacterized protein n=1 Tax=Nocardioides dubius TaxID=317019 RepID=A0ABN1TU68_9ACTN